MKINNIKLKTSIFTVLLLILIMLVFVPNYSANENAVSIKTESIERTERIAFLFGKITNFDYDNLNLYFEAVNLRIVSFIPLGYYHFKSGEKITMVTKAYFGSISEKSICALSLGVWF